MAIASAKDIAAATAAEAPVKRTRKPRDPNAPKIQRPLYFVYQVVNENDEIQDNLSVKILSTTRNPAKAMTAITSHKSAKFETLQTD